MTTLKKTKERPKPVLLPQFCKGCGRCIAACARDCIRLGGTVNPESGLVPVQIDLERCNGCGLCVLACPEPFGLHSGDVRYDWELPDSDEAIDGQPAYKVILTPKDGRPQDLFFEQASKLLVKVAMTVENPMGVIPLETFLGDYRNVDGILLPYTARVVVMGQERLMTTESIEQNVDLPEDRFGLPEEIRALIDDEPSEVPEAD